MDYIKLTYDYLCNSPSDINEHLPTLFKYASECDSVFETGVRGCVSSWAILYGLASRREKEGGKTSLLLNDIDPCEVQELKHASEEVGNVNVEWTWKNNLELSFERERRFDMTFIDTWHVYGQLKRELAKFSQITNKYIIMHDTTVDEWEGETIRQRMNAKKQSLDSGIPLEEINKGLWPAIEEFLESNPDWMLHERFTNNNGLTVLKKYNM
jgi:hypothetical protein